MILIGWDMGTCDTTVKCKVVTGLPSGFRIVGPIYKNEMHSDGRIIRKIDHRNGVVDVEVRHADGTVIKAIETK